MTELTSVSTIADRKAAQRYLDSSGVVIAIEQAINDGCLEKPRDLAGFIARHLYEHACAPPTIEHVLTVDDGLGDDGCTAVVAIVRCFHHGNTEIGGRAKVPLGTLNAIESQDASNGISDNNCETAEHLGRQIDKLLLHLDPRDTSKVDTILEKILETDAHTLCDRRKILATSLATLAAAARVTGKPAHEVVKNSMLNAANLTQLPPRVPTPVITAFLPALSGGKVKARGVWLVPPAREVESVMEDVSILARTYRALSTLAAKVIPAAGNTIGGGGLIPPKLDKLEQMLDMVREAGTAAGATKEAPVRVIIDVGASALWNPGKGKYELVSGAQKAPGDYVKDLCALAKARPEIVGICDPLVPEHTAEWQHALLDQLPQGCIVFGSRTGAHSEGQALDSTGGDVSVPNNTDQESSPDEDTTTLQGVLV